MTPSPSGPFGAEERHGTHLRHEDFEESRHAGEGTGKVLALKRVTVEAVALVF